MKVGGTIHILFSTRARLEPNRPGWWSHDTLALIPVCGLQNYSGTEGPPPPAPSAPQPPCGCGDPQSPGGWVLWWVEGILVNSAHSAVWAWGAGWGHRTVENHMWFSSCRKPRKSFGQLCGRLDTVWETLGPLALGTMCVCVHVCVCLGPQRRWRQGRGENFWPHQGPL